MVSHWYANGPTVNSQLFICSYSLCHLAWPLGLDTHVLRTFIVVSNIYIYYSNPYEFFQMTNWYILTVLTVFFYYVLINFRKRAMTAIAMLNGTCHSILANLSFSQVFNHTEISDRPLWQHCISRLRPQVKGMSSPSFSMKNIILPWSSYRVCLEQMCGVSERVVRRSSAGVREAARPVSRARQPLQAFRLRLRLRFRFRRSLYFFFFVFCWCACYIQLTVIQVWILN